jgi:carbonic anhydrase/acetyltransferase-like protein (isoleucine patch superfamily)
MPPQPVRAPSGDRHAAPATIDPGACVDPLASLVGAVTVEAGAYVGPGASIHADGGATCFLGGGSSVQDGAILLAPRGRVVLVEGRPFSLYVGRYASLLPHALVHGPCFVGDGCFLGARAIAHDAILGDGCVLGIGAVVTGVTIPPGRYVAHNTVVDSQDQADALPEVPDERQRLCDGRAEARPPSGDGILSAHGADAAV